MFFHRRYIFIHMLVFWRVYKWKGSDRGDINILGKISSNLIWVRYDEVFFQGSSGVRKVAAFQHTW